MTARTHSGTGRSYGIWLAAAAVLVACVWAYWPGLSGPFVFDDFGTIATLGDLGRVDDWHSFRTFVLGGHAGPTGRPLALLTLLVDGNTWPTDPWPFKRTNLVIHLLTGLALSLVVFQLLRVLDYPHRRAVLLTLLTTAFWLLHPFLVSTTLYAVQRMAQLQTLFVLLGIAGYLHGRVQVGVNNPKAYAVMTASLMAFTGLAVVSKENGVLLPLLVAMIEVTVFAATTRHARLDRYWSTVMLAAPSLLVVAYLGWASVRYGFFSQASGRDFSVYERLLTQARVLLDYLWHWFVPKLYTSGVFQDHVVKSTGLFSPWTTAASLVVHVSLIATAVSLRRRMPLLALAVLFFYAAHLLESTVLNLEMYFEHRNYLPAVFLILPIFAAAAERISVPVLASAAAVILVALCSFTRYSASIWSDYGTMVEAAARKAPTSARAQQQHAINLFNAGQVDAGLQVIERAIDRRPDNHSLLVTRVIMQCHAGAMNRSRFASFANAVGGDRYDPRLLESYSRMLSVIAAGGCGNLTATEARELFLAMLREPYNANPASLGYSHLQFFVGYTDAVLGDPDRAVERFEKSLASRPGPGHAMFMASVLASLEYFEQALALSDVALVQLDAGNRGNDRRSHVRENDIRTFQEEVRAAMQSGKSGTES